MTTKYPSTVLSFGMPADDAAKLHQAATDMGVPVSELLREIIYDRTDDLRRFDISCAPTAIGARRVGRKVKRFTLD